MAAFLLRRLIQGGLVVLGVTFTVFVVTRIFGNPVDLMLPLSASPEQRAAFASELGLDRPLPVQFVQFAGELLRFDFGESTWQRRPAMEVVLERLPNSLLLIGAGLGLAIVLSLPAGILAAQRPGGILDRIVTGLSLVGLSMPQFWVGLLLIVLFAVTIPLLPTSGMGSPAHLVLPAVTLALVPFARLTLLVRSQMMEELNKPYIRTALARGLPHRRVLVGHALRNALIPFLTLAGWELVLALAGYTVVVETVFAWPGMGLVAIQALQRGDLFLVQAIVYVVAVLIVLVNILLDLVFKLVDPRIGLG
ncbi:peptide/nickel transport system permease protein [Palleronia aestuarii]|uniref:Peptide/nickel transport system permease protein n=1 Tax=Palleronia aestuarii TaxID=568105 RepID=A0A2W7N9P7_9RHOB|nr:ABC transporter permease [Palleronia aestuarii]PZX17145.1 peptide/nickel transport system permease protein [Palleronia aestuarii]